MVLRVRKAAYRAWPVTVKLAESNEQGEIVDIEHTFVAHWKPISEKQRRQLVAELDKKFPPIPGPASPPEKCPHCGEALPTPAPGNAGKPQELDLVLERNAAYFAERLCGWGPEVQDEAGNPLPFSAEALADLVTGEDGLAISAALNLADIDLRYGLGARKNSPTSAAPGASAGAAEAETSSPAT